MGAGSGHRAAAAQRPQDCQCAATCRRVGGAVSMAGCRADQGGTGLATGPASKGDGMNEQVAPTWATRLIQSLQALWPVEKPLQLIMADADHRVWVLHDNAADGACNIRPDRITIFLRDHAEDSEYWRDVLIHEYT